MALNFGGAAGGALTGAAAGSAFGAPGAAIGGLLGGIGGLFGSKAKKPKKKNSFDPQQQALYNDYIGSLRGQGPFSGLYNFDANQQNQVFDQTVARPAYRGFQENIVPQVTGQFRGNNIMNSSYAGDALARRGRDVQENLDAERARYQFAGQQAAQGRQQQGLENILGMSTFGYQKPSNQPSTIDQILGGIAPMAGQAFGNYLSKGSGISGGAGSVGSLYGASGRVV